MGFWQRAVEALVEALSFLPDPVVVMVLAFSPLGEVRVSVPVAMIVYEMSWGRAAVWSLLGNLLVAPVAAWLYPRIEHVVRRSARGDRLLDRIYARTQRQQNARVEKLQEAAIAVLIAVPLPGSGAWTGVLVAHMFGLRWRHAWRYFYAGVVGATALVTLLVATGTYFV